MPRKSRLPRETVEHLKKLRARLRGVLEEAKTIRRAISVLKGRMQDDDVGDESFFGDRHQETIH